MKFSCDNFNVLFVGPFYLQGLCSIKISEGDIQTLSPDGIWEKYERFHQMNENPNMRFIYIYNIIDGLVEIVHLVVK